MILTTLALFAAGFSDEPAKPDPEKRVCKQQKQTGTRFTKTTCRTNAEWEAIAEAARKTAAESFNKPVINTSRE